MTMNIRLDRGEGNHIPVSAVSELQEYKLGEVVSVEQGDGIIAAEINESFNWPVGENEEKKIDASEEDPVYVVALVDGGSVAVSGDEISGDASIEDEEGEDISSWKDVGEKAGDAELAPVYDYVEGTSLAELRLAKKRYILDNYTAELSEHASEQHEDVSQLSYEELLNVPGVDDPEVGFSGLPDGWTRKSVLDAWASLGGMWRTCYARMIREMGPNFAKRWCAALKDEVLQTEEWRGEF